MLIVKFVRFHQINLFTKVEFFQRPDVGDEELPENEASPVGQSDESEEDEEEVVPAKGKPQDVRQKNQFEKYFLEFFFQEDESESSEVSWEQSDDESSDSSIDVDAPNEELYKKFLK